MALGDRNTIVVLSAAYLMVLSLRDLYDKNRGVAHRSTWFTAILGFLLALSLLVFARV